MFSKGPAYLFLATMALGIAGHGAVASETCQGSYTTALLQPLPAQVVVGLDIHDRSERNLSLTERFLAGVRDTGVAVGAQHNVLLHINLSQLGEATADPLWRSAVPSYSELSGLHGGLQQALPNLPSATFATPRATPAPPLLLIRVDATVGEAAKISWIATIQCQMIGPNEERLAEELGRIVGSTLGKRTERRPL